MTISRVVLTVAVLLAACGGDASGPSRADVVGSYTLTAFAFDPQGALPEVDLLPRLNGDAPRLILAPGGAAQLVLQDPATGLLTIANGTYSTPPDAVRVDFGTSTVHRTLLLSRRMTFTETATALTFDGTAPDGVDAQRLLQLVPEFAGEQLLDPVPGRLRVVFTRSP